MSAAAVLPALRPDLAIVRGPSDWDGSPTWTIHDRVRSRFFRIGWSERVMLRHWEEGEPAQVAALAAAELGAPVGAEAVRDLAAFLAANELLRHPAAPGRPRQGALAALLHGYLFFRLPLGSPDRLVAALTPGLERLLRSRAAAALLALLLLWGVVQTIRQWDMFAATLPPLATAGGMALYGAMLALSAVAHEFGHAFASRLAGCRVGTMGVAFIVMVPTLYTDTSDSWLLADRRRRLAVGLAGVGAEMILAILALALWSHLPEGAARSAAVALATTALATSVLINLSPLMRFDGYFIFSDLLGLANLQERAFALFRWHLRRLLFAIPAPPPEPLPPRLRAVLLGWALAAIPYRAALYLGIALLVYHSVFKLAGLALFAVEIGWFLALPCWRELRAWWRLRPLMVPRRTRLTLGLAVLSLLGLVLPWSGSAELPAAIEAARHVALFPPQPGRIADSALVPGSRVEAGALLLTLEAPDLRRKLADLEVRLAAARWQVNHLIARDGERDRIRVEEEALAALLREQAELQGQLARLEVRAPFAGIIIDRDPALPPGRWVGRDTVLADLADLDRCRVSAYVDEGALARLAPGAGGWFHPDGIDLPPVPVRLVRIDAASTRRLDDPYFAADLGGAIAVRRSGQDAVPARAVFGVLFEAEGAADCRMRRRGTVLVGAPPRSLVVTLLHQAVNLFNRERGL